MSDAHSRPSMPIADSAVICDECGRVELVAFANHLRFGWPECHEKTMRLLETNADIDAAVSEQYELREGGEPDPEKTIPWPSLGGEDDL